MTKSSTSPTTRTLAAPAAIRFFVPGIPAPQGSHKAFMPRGARYPVITDDNARTRPWRAMVALVASQNGDGDLLQGALSLTANFYLPRPRTLAKRIVEPTRKPDLSKLVRAIEDALTGVIWRDDAQVVVILATKHYGAQPGCEITVKELVPTKKVAEEVVACGQST